MQTQRVTCLLFFLTSYERYSCKGQIRNVSTICIGIFLRRLTFPSILQMFTREASVYRLGIVVRSNVLKERTVE